MTKPVYIVAGAKSWNRRLFEERLCRLPGQWEFIASRGELTLERLRALRPRYVFFLHWSWLVPAQVVNSFECVCFHMTDVPYGRGGSPLQNLIVRGHTQTRLTALRMTRDVDAGPVYLKEPLSLDGTAEEILIRAGDLSAAMIQWIIRHRPMPRPQRGRVTRFVRRTPAESVIGRADSLHRLLDWIRMLDAEGYPRAYLEHEGFRYEFSRATLRDGRLVADVTIVPASAKSLSPDSK